MFENFNRHMERAATNASRRQFLGRLGRGAIAAAASVAGLLVFTCDAEAARPCPPGYRRVKDKFAGYICVPIGKRF
jgi:hypothetical protein